MQSHAALQLQTNQSILKKNNNFILHLDMTLQVPIDSTSGVWNSSKIEKESCIWISSHDLFMRNLMTFVVIGYARMTTEAISSWDVKIKNGIALDTLQSSDGRRGKERWEWMVQPNERSEKCSAESSEELERVGERLCDAGKVGMNIKNSIFLS